MDEDIRPFLLRDKAKAFVGIKPLHGSFAMGDPPGMDGKKAATQERRS